MAASWWRLFPRLTLSIKRIHQDWLTRCQDNVTGWCFRVLGLRHGVSVLGALKPRAISRLVQQAPTVVKYYWDVKHQSHIHTRMYARTHTRMHARTHARTLLQIKNLRFVFMSFRIHTHMHTCSHTPNTLDLFIYSCHVNSSRVDNVIARHPFPFHVSFHRIKVSRQSATKLFFLLFHLIFKPSKCYVHDE